EDEASARIRKAVRKGGEPWDQVSAAVRTFFEIARSPEYRRIVVVDGPAVLGYERYREQEERSTFSVVQFLVDRVVPADVLPKTLTEPMARLLFGAMSSAGVQLSTAEDPEQAAQELQ